MNGRSQRIVIALGALVGVLGTARLGVWQLDRAAQKVTLQTAMETRQALPPLPANELARTSEQAAAQHQRRIVVAGRWQPAQTVYLDNRQMHGSQPGFYVVTPLVLADGSALVVQRGWLPRDPRERTRVEAPPLPEGEVQVAGRIAPPPARLYAFGGDDDGRIRQNLDLAEYAVEVGHVLRPLSLVQEQGPQTAADGLRRDWPHPAADVHKHYGYAFQWFALAALIGGLYVWFQLIRPRRRAR